MENRFKKKKRNRNGYAYCNIERSLYYQFGLYFPNRKNIPLVKYTEIQKQIIDGFFFLLLQALWYFVLFF